jgi:hypothetical protein
LNQVREAQFKLSSGNRNVPAIVYSGDIFDTWKSSPELINFAIRHLPQGYAIPGQHDLPLHNYQDINKSAYWTLVEAGVLWNLKPGHPVEAKGWQGVRLYGFPWGHKVTPCASSKKKAELYIAVIHAYCYAGPATTYPGANPEASVFHWSNKLYGYTVALFGDNHRGFLIQRKTAPDECTIHNGGTFMRRKWDERDETPSLGLVYADGTMKRYALECNDQWTDTLRDVPEENHKGIEEFMEFLGRVKDQDLNFKESVNRFLDRKKITGELRRLILSSLEE